MTVSIRLKGANNLAKRLSRLPLSMQNRILRPAISAGARPIRVAARSNVGQRDGGSRALARSIDMKVKTGSRAVYAVIGPRADARAMRLDLFGRIAPHRPAAIAHLVEDGSAPHVIMIGRGRKVRWQHPGSAGSHFMARAWQSTSGGSQRIIEAKIREGLDKHA